MQETQETQVQSLDGEFPLEKEMATCSSILAWTVPWIEEPSRLQSAEAVHGVSKESNMTEQPYMHILTNKKVISIKQHNFLKTSLNLSFNLFALSGGELCLRG